MRFLRPARIDDRLEIRTLVEVASGARVVCRQVIMRGNETLLEAVSENVCVGLDGRPRRLPQLFAERIAPYLPLAIRPVAQPEPVRELAAAG